MDPNGAPLPQVPEVPITPVEAPILPPVAEATPQHIEQLPTVAPTTTEPVFGLPQVAQAEISATLPSSGESMPSITTEVTPSSPQVEAQQAAPSDPPLQTPQALEEAEPQEVPPVKDVQGLERYRQPDELGQALEATLGSEVG